MRALKRLSVGRKLALLLSGIQSLVDATNVAYVLIVAQTSSLLYRGFPIRRPHEDFGDFVLQQLADWKSATQQVGNLRYEGCALRSTHTMLQSGYRSNASRFNASTRYRSPALTNPW